MTLFPKFIPTLLFPTHFSLIHSTHVCYVSVHIPFGLCPHIVCPLLVWNIILKLSAHAVWFQNYKEFLKWFSSPHAYSSSRSCGFYFLTQPKILSSIPALLNHIYINLRGIWSLFDSVCFLIQICYIFEKLIDEVVWKWWNGLCGVKE